MKNIIILSIISFVLILTGCKKDDAGAPTRLAINGAKSLRNSRSTSDLARLNWIAKHVWEVTGTGFAGGFNYQPKDHPYVQRDTINGKLFFFGDDAIGGINADKDGLGRFLSLASNQVFIVVCDSEGNVRGDWSETDAAFLDNALNRPEVKQTIDTVAYIPNAVIEKTRREVLEALKAGDNQRCYELFDKAIVFIPITGAEYRELEARGEN